MTNEYQVQMLTELAKDATRNLGHRVALRSIVEDFARLQRENGELREACQKLVSAAKAYGDAAYYGEYEDDEVVEAGQQMIAAVAAGEAALASEGRG